MIARRGRPARGDHSDEVPEYWVVYSDLLVSLLVVFLLMLFLALTRIQAQRKAEEQRTEAVKAVVATTTGALAAAVRSMGDSSISYDTATRTMTVRDEVLFAFGSATLRPESRELIRRIGGRFASAILTDRAVASQVQAIVVEGHTDTVGTYLSNLDLSQRRAQSVMRALVRETEGAAYAEDLRRLLVASGRSEVEAVRQGYPYDPAKARRIALRVQLKDNDLLQLLLKPSAQFEQRP